MEESKLVVIMPKQLHKKLKAISVDYEVSIKSIVIDLIQDYIKREENK